MCLNCKLSAQNARRFALFSEKSTTPISNAWSLRPLGCKPVCHRCHCHLVEAPSPLGQGPPPAGSPTLTWPNHVTVSTCSLYAESRVDLLDWELKEQQSCGFWLSTRLSCSIDCPQPPNSALICFQTIVRVCHLPHDVRWSCDQCVLSLSILICLRSLCVCHPPARLLRSLWLPINLLLVCQVKYEWWWVYVADKKSHLLITAPVQVCSLRSEEEVRHSHFLTALGKKRGPLRSISLTSGLSCATGERFAVFFSDSAEILGTTENRHIPVHCDTPVRFVFWLWSSATHQGELPDFPRMMRIQMFSVCRDIGTNKFGGARSATRFSRSVSSWMWKKRRK